MARAVSRAVVEALPLSHKPSGSTKRALFTGVMAGLVAGIPQVLVTQLEAWLLPVHRSHADIGPRFVARVGQKADVSLEREHHWLLAGAFPLDTPPGGASSTRSCSAGGQPSLTSGDPHWPR